MMNIPSRESVKTRAQVIRCEACGGTGGYDEVAEDDIDDIDDDDIDKDDCCNECSGWGRDEVATGELERIIEAFEQMGCEVSYSLVEEYTWYAHKEEWGTGYVEFERYGSE